MLRGFFIGIVCVALVSFVLLNVSAYKHANAMLFFSDHGVTTLKPEQLSLTQKIDVLFSGINIPRPSANLSSSVLHSNCKNIKIANGGKSNLGAWYCPSNHQKKLVILFHGYVTDKSSLIEEAKIFLQLDYSVLLVDFRGSWESSESYTTIGYREANDVASAINYAMRYHPHERVVLYGQSMGAAAIFGAIHSLDVKVDAIIVEAVFDKLLNTVKNRFNAMGVPAFPSAHLLVFWGGLQTESNGFDHNPVDYAKAVDMPVLLLHGENDTKARLFEARKVYESIPVADKRLSIFPDTAHESHLARFPEKWKNEVMDFLNMYL